MTSLNDRIWFSTEQAAEYAGCNVQTIRKAAASGALTAGQRSVKGRWRIHRDALDAWLRGDAA